MKQNNLNLHLKDLIKVQEYEENEFLQLIEEETKRSRKPVDIVDVRKKFHLRQLAKKSKINTIFGTSTSIVTIIILIIAAILLYKFCVKKHQRTGNTISHFNRIEERVLFREKPESEGTASGTVSTGTVSTDAERGTPINLREIIQK